MKKYILTILMLLSCSISYGQGFFRQLEFEIGPSVVIPLSAGGEPNNWWNYFGEIRYNFKNLPIDCGIHFGKGMFDRHFDGMRHYSDYRTTKLLIIGDYNFRKNKNVSPYIGLGLGGEYIKTNESFRLDEYISKQIYFCAMPRIGVEFFRVVRLSVGYNLIKEEFSTWQFSLGVAFGGWKRK